MLHFLLHVMDHVYDNSRSDFIVEKHGLIMRLLFDAESLVRELKKREGERKRVRERGRER